MSRRASGGVLCVLGTRPEAIKFAPVVHALAAGGVPVTICSTGQHRTLARATLADFGLAPDVDLDLMVQAQSPPALLAAALPQVTAVIDRCTPAMVVVQGDTASGLAGALAASYSRVPLAHIEAGLRSRAAEPFPEDFHRRLIAQAATHHFAPTAAAAAALVAEGIATETIMVTGNTVIDAVRLAEARLAADAVLRQRISRSLPDLRPGRQLVVVTAHRRENHARMPAIAAAVAALAQARDIDIVVPLHPHPAAGGVLRAALTGVARVTLMSPLDYLAFIMLLRRARLVLTDSGGIQEEGPAVDCPVLVLRDSTERHEGLAAGAARLVGTDPLSIVGAVCALLDDDLAHAAMAAARSPNGDGYAAARIAAIIAATFAVPRASAA